MNKLNCSWRVGNKNIVIQKVGKLPFPLIIATLSEVHRRRLITKLVEMQTSCVMETNPPTDLIRYFSINYNVTFVWCHSFFWAYQFSDYSQPIAHVETTTSISRSKFFLLRLRRKRKLFVSAFRKIYVSHKTGSLHIGITYTLYVCNWKQ